MVWRCLTVNSTAAPRCFARCLFALTALPDGVCCAPATAGLRRDGRLAARAAERGDLRVLHAVGHRDRAPPGLPSSAATAARASAPQPAGWLAGLDIATAARAQPFVDEDHFVQTLFPDWTYAIKIPAVLFVVLVTVIVAFISLVMIKSRKPKSS